VLHLFALLMSWIDIDLNTVNEVSEKTPNLCRLALPGKHHLQDLKTPPVVFMRL
jgi:dihydroxy-acid dehydratase